VLILIIVCLLMTVFLVWSLPISRACFFRVCFVCADLGLFVSLLLLCVGAFFLFVFFVFSCVFVP